MGENISHLGQEIGVHVNAAFTLQYPDSGNVRGRGQVTPQGEFLEVVGFHGIGISPELGDVLEDHGSGVMASVEVADAFGVAVDIILSDLGHAVPVHFQPLDHEIGGGLVKGPVLADLFHNVGVGLVLPGQDQFADAFLVGGLGKGRVKGHGIGPGFDLPGQLMGEHGIFVVPEGDGVFRVFAHPEIHVFHLDLPQFAQPEEVQIFRHHIHDRSASAGYGLVIIVKGGAIVLGFGQGGVVVNGGQLFLDLGEPVIGTGAIQTRIAFKFPDHGPQLGKGITVVQAFGKGVAHGIHGQQGDFVEGEHGFQPFFHDLPASVVDNAHQGMAPGLLFQIAVGEGLPDGVCSQVFIGIGVPSIGLVFHEGLPDFGQFFGVALVRGQGGNGRVKGDDIGNIGPVPHGGGVVGQDLLLGVVGFIQQGIHNAGVQVGVGVQGLSGPEFNLVVGHVPGQNIGRRVEVVLVNGVPQGLDFRVVKEAGQGGVKFLCQGQIQLGQGGQGRGFTVGKGRGLGSDLRHLGGCGLGQPGAHIVVAGGKKDGIAVGFPPELLVEHVETMGPLVPLDVQDQFPEGLDAIVHGAARCSGQGDFKAQGRVQIGQGEQGGCLAAEFHAREDPALGVVNLTANGIHHIRGKKGGIDGDLPDPFCGIIFIKGIGPPVVVVGLDGLFQGNDDLIVLVVHRAGQGLQVLVKFGHRQNGLVVHRYSPWPGTGPGFGLWN